MSQAFERPPRDGMAVFASEIQRKAFADLCNACRAGDIDLVDSLLATPDLDINQVDEWDYSPLILSSLCGHLEIVRKLLANGAVCDRDTFQGARCVYGALNDTIRDLLLSFEVSKAVDLSQPFASHISSLLSGFGAGMKDICFYFKHVNGVMARKYQYFRVNRFLLAARSSYFRAKLTNGGPWVSRIIVDMPFTADPAVFSVVVDYLYLRTDGLPLEKPEIQEELLLFARKLQLHDLAECIVKIMSASSSKEISKIKNEYSYKFVVQARAHLHTFLEQCIFTSSQEVVVEEDIDAEDIEISEHITNSQRNLLFDSAGIPDVIVAIIDSDVGSVIYYPVNKSILTRSEYFDTMFKSDIFTLGQLELPTLKSEKTGNIEVIDRALLSSDHLPVLQLSNSISKASVAEMVLSYLYHDDLPHIPLETTVELLFAADELFLDRLRTKCAVNISSNFPSFSWDDFQRLPVETGYSAFDLVRVAWQTRCDKLEQHITKMIAHNLAHIFNDKDLRQELLGLIRESADRINVRQDTDTIELIDDIRYFLSKKYHVRDEFADFDPIGFTNEDPSDNIRVVQTAMQMHDNDIEMIDSLLEELQLDA